MASVIAWLDASAEDQRRMREIVKLFSQRESRDELGIGQIRDALSDTLFPGTSTLHTRARYLLFVPWCFREGISRSNDAASASKRVEKAERQLISALRAARDQGADVDGMLGSNVGEALKTLPSAIYWSALRQYAILADGVLDPQDAIGAEIERRSRRITAVEEDEGPAWHAGGWWATLPSVPDGFPGQVADGFAMTYDEAGWLRERMEQGAPGSALTHILATRPSKDSPTAWADPAMQSLVGEPRAALEHARKFSVAMHGAALLYNVLLAEAYAERGFDRVRDEGEKHRPALARWSDEVSATDSLGGWDLDEFWELVLLANPRVSPASRAFVDGWLDLIRGSDLTSLADSEMARAFIGNREWRQKRSQARLRNEKLLSAWSGASGSGRLDFRWGSVRAIVTDIHDGLERVHA
ncbi:DUF6361 family protein [Agromyces sp. MMS24-K17]|uniref:DUF6361 family protein n=1 Tax=Agromyces sp. MMS24-K17 TaxID=3372850 RepID=UPI003754B098